MSKVLSVASYCDNPTHLALEPAAHEHTDTLDGATWTYDLCAACEATRVSLVRLAVSGERKTRRYTKRAARALPTVCPECGYTSVSRGGLGKHLRQTHEKSIRDYPGSLALVEDYEGLAHGPAKQ